MGETSGQLLVGVRTDTVIINQLFFCSPFHTLDLDLSSHRTAPVRLLLNVNQPDRTPAARVAGTAPAVMLAEAPHRVGCPAGVIGPVGTFENIAITEHGGRSIRIRFLVAPPEEFIQAANLLFKNIADFWHFLSTEFDRLPVAFEALQ